MPRTRVLEVFGPQRKPGNLMCIRREYATRDRYSHVHGPGAQQQRISGVARNAQGRPLAKVVFSRSALGLAFVPDDHAMLERLLPYVERALMMRETTGVDYAKASTAAFLTLTSRGQIRHASGRAREILSLAERSSAGRIWGRSNGVRPSLSRCIETIDSDGRPPANHVFDFKSVWGRFMFRCERLDSTSETADALIGVSIEHHEPAELVAMRAMQARSLSIRQKQICLMLRQQRSIEDIARETGVSRTTVKDHVKKIYSRFGVHTREELIGKLLEYHESGGLAGGAAASNGQSSRA
ncbi:MAG: helix-turn-helix transcriptional regulator [Clostridia bacterium]|nr:helix-turn-helix transcriptional regulator [Deltaproteobacteria bacterium]